jgi:hypothetical protein
MTVTNLTQRSSQTYKENIRQKCYNNKDYLNRILNTKVYSYTFKQDSGVANNGGVYLGCLYEEIYTLFNSNITSCKYKPLENEDQSILQMADVKERSINYSQMVLYVILAFQQFYNDEHIPLKTQVNNLQNTVNSLQTTINNMQTVITALVNRLANTA